ncbi:MAG: hypothetical protein ABEJ57_00310 [Halobacteriaceae archaeon]
MSAYVLEIKPSARRRNVVAAEWVQAQGPRRTFHSKAAARRWAARVSGPHRLVWIQDAAPNDPAPVDGYLVGGRREHAAEDAGGAQSTLAAEDAPAGQEGAEEEI